MDMSIIILAGGLATRLRPISFKTPKSLIKVNGTPFIDHQLNLIKDQGIKKVVLSCGHLGEKIEKHVGSGHKYNLQIEYSYDGKTLLGTGGAIKKALPLLSDNFIVLYGDAYLLGNYIQIASKLTPPNLGLMTLFRNKDKFDSSNVIFENGKVLKYDKNEKNPQMEYIDWGISVFNKKAFSNFLDKEQFDLSQVFQALIKNNFLQGHEVTQRFYQVGSPAGLKELANFLKHGIDNE